MKMKKSKAILRAAMLVCMSLMAGRAMASQTENAFAALKGNVDMTKKGSITFSITDPGTGTGFSGINMELTQVASVTQNADGNYVYKYTPAFTSSSLTVNINDLSETDTGAREKAETLRAYTTSNSIRVQVQTTDATGKVTFTNLDLGVYLLQNYHIFPPFFL